jgi:thiol-disulfide isomerase/thioredoxin
MNFQKTNQILHKGLLFHFHAIIQKVIDVGRIPLWKETALTLREMNELFSIEEIDHFINSHHFAFLYISKTNCSVCHALLPKVKEVMADFPNIHLAFINTDHIPDIAGHLSIFTAPVLILYVDGQEVLREARFVHIDPFREKIEKIYRLAK